MGGGGGDGIRKTEKRGIRERNGARTFPPEALEQHGQRRGRASAISIGRRAGASREPRGEADARGVRRSDEDAEEPEGEDDDETSSEKGEGVEEEPISNAQRGRVRLRGRRAGRWFYPRKERNFGAP